MNYTTSNSSITYSGHEFVLAPESGGRRPKDAPKGLIVTQAVQTKAGWVGQILVDQSIVFETSSHPNSDEAIDEVNKRVVSTITRLFVEPEDV